MRINVTPRQALMYVVFFLVCLAYVYFGQRRHATPEQKAAVVGLQARTKIQFDEANAAHARGLEEVRSKFDIDAWTELGFQRRESPVTDFRGFGFLTLDCLRLTQAHLRLKKFRSGEPDELPFALLIINVGNTVLTKMAREERFLAQFSFTRDGYLAEFVTYLDKIILDFERFWLARKPANIMAFNAIWREYESRCLQ